MFGLTVGVLLAAVGVGILSAARLTRLVVNDHWPPLDWLKTKWDARSERLGGWWILLHCPWCFAPWITLFVGAWAVLSNLHWTWWAVNGWLGFSYVAAWLVYHDQDGSGDDE